MTTNRTIISGNYTAYLAPEDYLEQLLAELGKPHAVHGKLVVVEGPAIESAWAQNIWHNAEYLPIESIGDAAKKLKSAQRNWALYSFDHHRRANLIQEQLPHVSAKPIVFPNPAPTAPLGSYCLVEKNLLLAAQNCSSAFPNGEISFVENKTEPPSRAYLKLWEALTRFGVYPKPGDNCLDIGASPGGWSWVVSSLGARVTAVDRSPLEGVVANSELVEFVRGDAFAFLPEGGKSYDWIFSDVAAFPEKLLEWVRTWLESGQCKNFVCTLKFSGKEHYKAIKGFQKLGAGKLCHLHNNKHELTWVCLSN